MMDIFKPELDNLVNEAIEKLRQITLAERLTNDQISSQIEIVQDDLNHIDQVFLKSVP